MKRILTLVLSCLLVLGSVVAFPSCASLDDLNTITPEQNIVADGMLITPGDAEGITLASRKLAVAEYEEYDVAAVAESAYSITATVLPEDAGNKEIDWALSFVDSSSEWAQDKSVQDYVSLAISDTQATLSCMAAFGAQVQITATSVADPTKTACCTLDYAQRIDSAYLNFGNVNINLGGITEITYEVSKEVDGPGGAVSAGFHTNKVHTVPDDFECYVSIHPCSAGTLNLRGHKIYEMAWHSLEGTHLDLMDGYSYGTEIFFDYVHDICKWKHYDSMGLFSFAYANCSADELLQYFSSITSPWLYTVQLDIEGTYSSYTYTSDLKCVGAVNSTPVESVAFDYLNFVF